MKEGEFIWADLSTYDLDKSIPFYEKVFKLKMVNNGNYFVANNNYEPLAGIYETPDFFKKIRMPHFWMSYFQVNSIEKTVTLAEKLNAKIEIRSAEFYNGKIALIRDLQGAGFTIYDGKDLQLSRHKINGSIANTELHVSNVTKVIPFYSSLLGWEIINLKLNEYQVKIKGALKEIYIREIQNLIKGEYEYWVTTIFIDNLKQYAKQIINEGGSLISEEENRNLMTDNSGEAFFYIEQIDQ